MNSDDLKALRVPILLLLLALAGGGAAVYATYKLWQAALVTLQRQETQLRTAQSRLQRSGDEKTIIVKYVNEYRKLERAGFIGGEQRINWLDALRLANERTDLFGVNYQIGVQQGYPHAAALNPGKMKIQQSIMKLDIRLLHELDLLRFFNALRAQGAGLFHVDQCKLQLTNTTGEIRYQPNINATCELAWITAAPETTAPGARP